MKVTQIKPQDLERPDNDWSQIWAGSWYVLSCSHFAVEYVDLIRFHGKPFLSESVIVVKNGKSQGWTTQEDRQEICDYLAEEVTKEPNRVEKICIELKKQVDLLRDFLKNNINNELTTEIFKEYFERLITYYQPHINVKYVVDGLTAEQLEEHFQLFEDARLYAENSLEETEEFLIKMAEGIAKKEKLTKEAVLACTYQEIEKYLQGDKLPDQSILEKRNEIFVIYSNNDSLAYFDGDEAKKAEEVLTAVKEVEELKGVAAQKGKVSGTVKIIIDPRKASNFQDGDILVTGMTRPDFLPLMNKAAAFVTDSGGLLSHAAIVAREMKKPCVIGTKIATKLFKDGDQVEVDAEKGIVKKLK